LSILFRATFHLKFFRSLPKVFVFKKSLNNFGVFDVLLIGWSTSAIFEELASSNWIAVKETETRRFGEINFKD